MAEGPDRSLASIRPRTNPSRTLNCKMATAMRTPDNRVRGRIQIRLSANFLSKQNRDLWSILCPNPYLTPQKFRHLVQTRIRPMHSIVGLLEQLVDLPEALELIESSPTVLAAPCVPLLQQIQCTLTSVHTYTSYQEPPCTRTTISSPPTIQCPLHPAS